MRPACRPALDPGDLCDPSGQGLRAGQGLPRRTARHTEHHLQPRSRELKLQDRSLHGSRGWTAPQHAGCTGKVENCVTTVFSAYVTTSGQAWVDFDVYMPARWADDLPRRRAAGIPGDLEFATKPQLATRQLERLTAAGLPATWVAFDEVYGRSEHLRKTAARAGLAYAA